MTLITERYSIGACYKFIDQSVCSFVCVETYHPVNNFSVMSERDGQIGVHKKISTVFVMKRGELS